MSSEVIQNQIIGLIPQVTNKKILKAVHAILEHEVKPLKLNQSQLDEIDRREEHYLKNEGKNYTWEEAKTLIRSRTPKNV